MSLKKYKNFGISCLVAGAMILGGLSFFQPTKVYADALPQSFEYNIEDMGLTVGDQGNTGLCWAYTSSKVLETLIYNVTTPNTAFNISEDWISLAYMYYVNDENQTLATEKPLDNTEYVYSITGIPYYFQRVISAYGIMLEDDFTLTESITTENYKEIFEASQGNAHKDIVVDFDVVWAGNYYVPGTTECYYDSQNPQDSIVAIIKNCLVNSGAVYTAVEGITAGAEDYYVYHSTTANLNHAMTIIGYDDTRQIDVGGEVKTGAFTLLNSYGDYRQIVYMPYDMMASNIQDNIETNNVLGNTFVFENVEFYTDDDTTNPENPDDPNQSVDPNPDEPTEPETPTEPDEPTEPSEPDEPSTDDPSTPVIPNDPNDQPNDPNDDISGGTTSNNQNTINEILNNLLGRYEEKSGGEKAVVVFAVLAMLMLAGVGIGFGVVTFIRRSQTAAINQATFGNSVQQYRMHQLSMQQQKADLEKQIADMRADAQKRKQRRLKREFKKKLEENESK